MPLERKPKNPIPRNFVPANARPYRVQDGDSFVTLAKLHRMEVWELIYENFRTRDELEVNWYLRNYVGCDRPTRDGRNWIFTLSARPGIIHVPRQVIELPPIAIEAKLPAPELRHVWAGIGVSHSGDVGIFGAHSLYARLYKLSDELPDVRNANICVAGFKWGPGLGASISGVFVVAYGYDDAGEMNNTEEASLDYEAAFGAKLGDVLKGIRGFGRSLDTIQKFKKARYVVENAFKNRHFSTTKPGLYVFPIPAAGAGLHVWMGYKSGDVVVMSTGEGIP